MTSCPPYQDVTTLAGNLSICTATVDNWVQRGILPPAVLRGGKRLWKWSQVEEWIDRGPTLVRQVEDIRENTRRAINEH